MSVTFSLRIVLALTSHDLLSHALCSHAFCSCSSDCTHQVMVLAHRGKYVHIYKYMCSWKGTSTYGHIYAHKMERTVQCVVSSAFMRCLHCPFNSRSMSIFMKWSTIQRKEIGKVFWHLPYDYLLFYFFYFKDKTLGLVRSLLQQYEKSHNFHNFTSGK